MISSYITEAEQLWAHTTSHRTPESLLAHVLEVRKQWGQLCDKNNLMKVIRRTVCRAYSYLSEEAQEWIVEALVEAIELHDIGKINPGFQYLVVQNPFVSAQDARGCDRHHALLSAALFLHIYVKKIKAFKGTSLRETRRVKSVLHAIIAGFAYGISRHHTYLQDVSMEKFLQLMEERIVMWKRTPQLLKFYKERESFLEDEWLIPYYTPASHENEIAGYLLLKLLYSALVASDFYASYRYFNEKEPTFHYLQRSDKERLLHTYQQTDVYQSIQQTDVHAMEFKKASMNILRTSMFLEAFESLKREAGQHSLLYLEAPTGSGKTNTALHLGLQTLLSCPALNKMLYIFPFNTLADQTYTVLHSSLGDEYRIQIVNSITPLLKEEPERKEIEDQSRPIDYNEELLMRQMWQYPITLTSHVNFFHVLFGTSRESNLALVHVCNSVVILDEIQSYRSAIWKEMIAFLTEIGECFGITFFVMSATLPRLHELIDTGLSYGELLPNAERYMQHPIFKNRVVMDFTALAERWSEREEGFRWIHQKIQEYSNKRILVQFISKQTAADFFAYLQKHDPTLPVMELTGDDNRPYRKDVIRMMKEEDGKLGAFVLQHIVLIATQVIEAGVDVDFDIGFKDISILDAEEQFLGRINRSHKREGCKAYFFNLDPEGRIYLGDWRLELNISQEMVQTWAREKTFAPFYRHVMKRMREDKGRMSSDLLHNYELFLSAVGTWKFKTVAHHMKLIDKNEVRLFLNCTLRDGEGRLLDGQEVWERYKALLKDRDMPYAEKRVKLLQMGAELEMFIYGLQCDPDFLPSHEIVGDIRFVEDGERFMEEDARTKMKRFQRVALLEAWGLV